MANPNIDAGLVWWGKLNEGSGSTAIDTVSGNNGTLVNSPTYVAGKVGPYALQLTGASSQYVTLPAGFATILAGLTSFTFAGWVDPATLSAWQRVFDFGTGTTSYMFLTLDNGATGTPRFAITTSGGGGEQIVTAPSAVSTTAWHFVVVSLNSGTTTAKLYIDSPTAVATNTGVTLTPTSLGTTTNNYLGKSQYADPYFNGNIQDFRLYNRALSDDDIELLMSYTGVAANVSSNLAARWMLNEGSGTTAWDTSGNANTGTLQNSPTYSAGRTNAMNALNFVSASSQLVTAGATGLPLLNANFTYMAWIYVNSAGSGIRDIILVGDGSTISNQFAINAALQPQWAQWGGNVLATSTNNVGTNIWTHVALKYNSVLNKYGFYIGGIRVGAGTPSGTPQTGTPTQTILGSWGYGEFFWGQMSDVRVYARCLTDWDITLAASDQPWG